MSTLKELIEGRELPVKVTAEVLKGDYLEITHRNKSHCLGTYGDGRTCAQYLYDQGWEHYEEPKKKVKVALYAYKNYRLYPFWKISSYMYSNDKDAKSMLSAEIFKRLDYSEIEVNDE